jgi:hypothetical protein
VIIRFELQGMARDVRPLLRSHGWRLDEGGPGNFHASHAGARDQPAARVRLHRLGLLTYARVRIEFGRPG